MGFSGSMRVLGATLVVCLGLICREAVNTPATAQERVAAPSADSLGPPFALTGRVVDALTGQPIVAAVIKVPELERFTQSNLDGRFDFAAFPPGTWQIVIEQLGYRTSQGTVTVSRGNGLEIQLQPDPVTLEGLTVRPRSYQVLARRRMRTHYVVEHISPTDIAEAINPDPTAVFRRHAHFPVSTCLIGVDWVSFDCPVTVYVDEGRLLGGMLEFQMYPLDSIHSMDWIPKLAQLRVYTKHFVDVLDRTRISVLPIMSSS
ncbi:MAG: carboxypeptidase-like regulatory domain-containing protein [Gemmatimonadetes bacterium]|nr:carboxypeptidase-like regulatory domain-containing protein [Gemmatimonadota bacterium]